MRLSAGTRITMLVVVVLGFVFAAPLAGQTAPSTGQTEKDPPKKSSSTNEKLKLEEVTRVSTEKAVQSASKEKAKPSSEEKKAHEASGESEVTEFHPAPPEDEKPDPEARKTSKKSAAKNIHGSVYGAGGRTGSAAGGAAGTTTKSGKTSVYVESEKTRTTNPAPH